MLDNEQRIVMLTIWHDESIDISGDVTEMTDMGMKVVCDPLFHSQVSEVVIDKLSNADYVIAGSERFDKTTLPYLKKLKLIVRFGVGYDNVDLKCARECGIAVTNLPGSNAFAVAEHVLGMMIAVTHRMVPFTAEMRVNTAKPIITDSICGTVGIIGFGAIGRQLARLLAPFGVRLVAFDPYVGAETMAEYGAEKLSLEELARVSNLVSLHLPACPETHHLVNREFLSMLPRGAYIFNCARGALMDEAAVAEALESGILSGVGSDVYETEPTDGKSPLLSAKNVVLTPHCSAATKACFHSVLKLSANQIAMFERGEALPWLLN